MNTNDEAKWIINAFLALFPGPECREQQEVVDRANEWLKRKEAK